MRDFLTDPAWQAKDLGRPLPDSPNAISVAMPLWEHVIGYEEEDPAVLEKLQCGYPRFFLHPRVCELNARLESEHAGAGERALAFPDQYAAGRAEKFLSETRGLKGARIAPDGTTLIMPESQRRVALEYWRFSGEIVSSRAAEAGTSGLVSTNDHDEIIERLSALTGQSTENIFLLSSGMAATFTVHRMLQERNPDRGPLQLEFPYVDVLKVQSEFGWEGGTFVSDSSSITSDAILKGRPCGVFCELASNPLMRSVDLVSLTKTCRAAGVPLAIDDTVATAINADVFPFADIVTTSLTKYFAGSGDVLAGAIIINGTSPFCDEMRTWLRREIAPSALHPADAAVLAVASRDFGERMEVINKNAEELVGMLENHPAVEHVYYPTRETPELYDQIRRPHGGGGGLLSIVLKDAARNAPRFHDNLRVSKGPSFGTRFTLACPYSLLAHYPELDWAESCGVSRWLVRVGVGIETDLIGRFEDALEA